MASTIAVPTSAPGTTLSRSIASGHTWIGTRSIPYRIRKESYTPSTHSASPFFVPCGYFPARRHYFQQRRRAAHRVFLVVRPSFAARASRSNGRGKDSFRFCARCGFFGRFDRRQFGLSSFNGRSGRGFRANDLPFFNRGAVFAAWVRSVHRVPERVRIRVRRAAFYGIFLQEATELRHVGPRAHRDHPGGQFGRAPLGSEPRILWRTAGARDAVLGGVIGR